MLENLIIKAYIATNHSIYRSYKAPLMIHWRKTSQITYYEMVCFVMLGKKLRISSEDEAGEEMIKNYYFI